ncbi:hypothetical protein [Bacillus sp. FJAT-27245]|uniref:hypothetical protein n=1 Tax=Bacillus sp. FJAT-27245 TaxID=1684144 RepID=UPI0012E2633A|nr:hypothetical protein [Bacillus sp. FJAT-27245]
MASFEGKTNTTGWRYNNKHLVYKDMSTPLKWKKHDGYVSEILSHLEKKTPFTYSTKKKGETQAITDFYHVKYVRIVRKAIRGKVKRNAMHAWKPFHDSGTYTTKKSI